MAGVWHGIAGDLLGAIVDGYTARNRPLPPRRYISALPTPADPLPHVAVGLEQTVPFNGDVMAAASASAFIRGPGQGMAMRAGVFVVNVGRTIPNLVDDDGYLAPGLPAPDAEADASQLVTDDHELLVEVLIAAYRAGDLGVGCGSIGFGAARTVNVSGGMAVVRLSVNVAPV